METDVSFWALALLAAFFVGCSKGGLQLLGLLSVPILSLKIPAGQAAGLILPIYVLSDWYGLWLYRHEYSKRNIAILIPAGIVGILIGWALAHLTDENMVKLLVAVIAVAYLVDAIVKPGEGAGQACGSSTRYLLGHAWLRSPAS